MSLKNTVTPPGIDPWTFGLVAQHLNHYANPDPNCKAVLDVFDISLNNKYYFSISAKYFGFV
jgi:hypothetical protein